MTLEEFKTLRQGDKVNIIDTPVSGTKYGAVPMDKWCGKIMTVRYVKISVDEEDTYAHMEEDVDEVLDGWSWYPCMIEKKVSGTITMEIPESGDKILTETEVKIMKLEREFAELREQIKDELARLKSRLFDYIDKK